MSDKKITIIIPTLSRPAYLEKCLISIQAQTLKAFECIIVDQSEDGKTKRLFENFDLGETKKIYLHNKIKSLILARNKGLSHVGPSQFTCFLDDDLEIRDDFFEKILAPFFLYPERNYAGGMGSFGPRAQQKRFLSSLFLLPRDGDGKFLFNGFPTFPHWKNEFSDVEFLSGGLTVYLTPIVKEYRYDERLVGYGHGDDVDISYRVSRSHRLFYEPKALCIHDINSPGREAGFVHRKNQIQNFYYLMQKNMEMDIPHVASFWWMVLGQVIDDSVHFRKGAAAGNLAATLNILKGKLDSVAGYDEFVKGLQK